MAERITEAMVEALREAQAELMRLRRLFLPEYEGKIGEPKASVLDKISAALQHSQAALPVGKDPVAWVHILVMDAGNTAKQLSFSKESPFGTRGFDYSGDFEVVSYPLSLALPVDAEGATRRIEHDGFEGTVITRRSSRP